jgi:hypothetical protein
VSERMRVYEDEDDVDGFGWIEIDYLCSLVDKPYLNNNPENNNLVILVIWITDYCTFGLN